MTARLFDLSWPDLVNPCNIRNASSLPIFTYNECLHNDAFVTSMSEFLYLFITIRSENNPRVVFLRHSYLLSPLFNLYFLQSVLNVNKGKSYANSTTLICFRRVYLYRPEIKCIVKMVLPLRRLVSQVEPTINGDHWFSD